MEQQSLSLVAVVASALTFCDELDEMGCIAHQYRIFNSLYPVTSSWWNDVVQQFNEQQFRECFRMSKDTFERLCSAILEAERHTNDFNLSGSPIPIAIRVAMTVYYLSRVTCYRDVGNIFGIPKTTCWKNIRGEQLLNSVPTLHIHLLL